MNAFDTFLAGDCWPGFTLAGVVLEGLAAHAGSCWPGFAPAGELLWGLAAHAGREWPGGHSLSFASPKERKQRKSEPAVCVPALRFGQPAVLASGRGALELATLKQSRALISLKLCSSAQTEGRRAAQSARLVALCATLPDCVFAADELACHFTKPHTHKSALGHSLLDDLRRCLNPTRELPKPGLVAARAKQSAAALAAVEAGLSSAGAGGKRAGDCLSEASSSQTPPDTSRARHRAAARTSARLFFGYFHLAKQKKVTRPPGRDPANGAISAY